MNGWIKVHRVTLEGPLRALTSGQRWVWVVCLALANIRPGQWFDGRGQVAIPAGSFITSQEHLAEKAGVSRIVVRHALQNLTRIGLIRAQPRPRCWTLIEIVDWESCQSAATPVSPAVRPARAHTKPRASHNERRGEERQEERGTRPYRTDSTGSDQGFEEFWSLYPRKAGKRAAQNAWRRLAPDPTLRARILAAVQAQRQSDGWCRDEGRYVPHPGRWLADRRWEDEAVPEANAKSRRVNEAWKNAESGEVKL